MAVPVVHHMVCDHHIYHYRLCIIYSYLHHIRTLEVGDEAGLSFWLLTARH